jgi:hypothetical protein
VIINYENGDNSNAPIFAKNMCSVWVVENRDL